MSPWLWLLLAGAMEVAWAAGLKASAGFTRPGVTALTVTGMILSFLLLAQAMKSLPLGTSYAVWTGIGAIGSAIVGMVWLGEPRDLARLLCAGLIVSGIIGLRLLAKSS